MLFMFELYCEVLVKDFVCLCVPHYFGRQSKGIKKKLCTIPHLGSDFGTCIHNYSGIMDVLQGTLAFASESWGELTLSWLIIEQFLKFNHIWPPVFLFVVEAVIFKLGLRPSSGWLLIQAVLLLRLDLLLLPIVLLGTKWHYLPFLTCAAVLSEDLQPLWNILLTGSGEAELLDVQTLLFKHQDFIARI